MPQLVIAAAAGAALLLGYRWAKREALRQAATVRARATNRPARDLGALVYDDSKGVYRPRD